MYSLLLLNGGVGKRVGAQNAKQFLKLNGVPVLIYSLAIVDRISEITEIVLNYPPGEREQVERLIADYAIRTPIRLVPPGRTRQESVSNLLQHTQTEDLILHEAARPLVSESDFRLLLDSQATNVSLMLPIPFTVAPVDLVNRRVTGSLQREKLRNVQLPQKFKREDLVEAHRLAEEQQREFTEDATMLAEFGFSVCFLEGNEENFKITTPLDLRVAGAILTAEEI